MLEDVLTAGAVLTGLPTRWLGRPAYVFDAIPSTNTWLMGQAGYGATEGTLALADVQTAGRGRLGRTWHAPPGSALLFSLLFQPPPTVLPSQVMMAVSVGIAAGLTDHLGVAAQIKWPNDILLGGRKLAGLLGESTFLEPTHHAPSFPRKWESRPAVVIGVGLNVNLADADLPPPPPDAMPPTSLRIALGQPIPRIPLLHALLAAIETRYDALRQGDLPLAEWRSRCATLGQAVRVTGGGAVVEGVAEDVAADGALLVRQADGRLVTVAAGDVTLRT